MTEQSVGTQDTPRVLILLAAQNEAFLDSPFPRVAREQRQNQHFLSENSFGKGINFGRARFDAICPYFELGETTISSEEFMRSAMQPVIKKTRVPKRPDHVTGAAQSLVGELEGHRVLGRCWLTLSQLIDRVPGLSAELAQVALRNAPAKSRIVVASPADPSSLLVLKEDLESLAHDDTFLKSLVQTGCTADAPVQSLSELTRSLDKRLKKLVDNYWPQHVERLPAGLVPMSIGSGRKKLFAIHDERFSLPDVELSHQLIAALQSQKEAGQQAYPTSWPALIQATGGVPSDDLLRRATLQKPFVCQARQVSTNGKVWVAFTEDVSTIVCSELFLQCLVKETCHSEQPEVKLTALAKQVPKDLQQQFLNHWLPRVEHVQELEFANVKPAGTAKKRDVLLRDRRFPPAELALAENFVKILSSQKAIGGISYPTTWQRLVELAGTTTLTVRDKAVKTEKFQSQVVWSFARAANAPLSLIGDEALLANSPRLLFTVLEKTRTIDNHVVAVEKLIKHKGVHPAVRPLLQSAIERKIAENVLPAGIGALKVGKKWALFLMADAIGTNSPAVPPLETSQWPISSLTTDLPTVVDTDRFASDFDAAFAKLDGKLGLPHYASLVDLRPALKQYSRDQFDQELLKLRRAGRYSLSLVEGRFGLSEGEQAACLVVDNVPHLLVQKK